MNRNQESGNKAASLPRGGWTKRAGLALVAVAMLPGLAGAAVVTDNNLATTSLPNLTNPSGATVSNSNFATVTNQLVAVQANVTNTFAVSPANGYVIDRLAPGGGATVVNWGGGIPPGYNAIHTLPYAVSGANSLSYVLNEGSSGFKQYVFEATNIKFHRPAGADSGLIVSNGVYFGGNIVPNASFEDPSLIFFGGGGGDSIVADPGKHGSYVYRKIGTVDSYVALPVVPGQQYAYSFWYKIDTDNYGQVEWGLSPLGFSTAIAPGNSGTGLLPNTGGQWIEATGLFTPAAGQNFFYIGGLANEFDAGQGTFFDSLFVAAPEPSAAMLLALGGLVLWRRRK